METNNPRNDQEEAIRQAHLETERLYAQVLGTSNGRKVLRHLVLTFNHNDPSFTGPEFNSYKAAQADGQKQVINHMLRLSSKPAHHDTNN